MPLFDPPCQHRIQGKWPLSQAQEVAARTGGNAAAVDAVGNPVRIAEVVVSFG
ncbi:MAG: hypothetical protein ACRYFS_15545 [Janthinobacterium lividum]